MKIQKILKQWNDYCKHDIFYIQNEDGVFVWYSHDRIGTAHPKGERGTESTWRKCDFDKIPIGHDRFASNPMIESTHLEFVVLTGLTIEESLQKDYYESQADKRVVRQSV